MSSVTNSQNIREWDEKTKFILGRVTDEGDFYRKHFLNPALFSLLGNVKGKTVLDAGCGEGYLCRLLAKRGAEVTGLEPADGLIGSAIGREKKEKLGITYIKEDLSKWKSGQKNFDIIVSNMVFMDIPDFKPAIKNCIAALKPKGVFVFSISHPCFDSEGKWEENEPYVKVGKYFEHYSIQNYIGYSFHRTLSEYLNFVIEEGCVIKKVLEPGLPPAIAGSDTKYIRDRNIPNFIVVKTVRE